MEISGDWLILRGEIVKGFQLPGIEILVILGSEDTPGKQTSEERRFRIALDNLTEFVSTFFRVREYKAVGDTNALGKPMAYNLPFIDIEHSIRYDTDFLVNTIPLLCEQNNVSTSMSMLKEVRDLSLSEILMVTGISE